MALRFGVRLLQELTEHSSGLTRRLAVHRLADDAPTQRSRSLAHGSAGRRRAGQPEQHVRQSHGQIVSPLIRRLKVLSEVPHCPLRGFGQR